MLLYSFILSHEKLLNFSVIFLMFYTKQACFFSNLIEFPLIYILIDNNSFLRFLFKFVTNVWKVGVI